MPPEATDRRTDPNSDRRRVRRGGRRSRDPRHSYEQALFERYGLQRRNDLIGDRMDRQKNWRGRSSSMLP